MLPKIYSVLLIFAACLSLGAQSSLRVAAAADLQPVLPPILAQFQTTTGIHAEATYQASAALTMQIQNGAPFDIFFSADLGYPQRLITAGLAEGLHGTPVRYARGTLVLWVRKDSRLNPPSLEVLRSPALKRLAIANPERAPYGRAAVATLKSLGLTDSLRGRIASAENIAQAAQFVDSGNADAGLISLTSALTPRLSTDGTYFVIPRNLYPPIDQGAARIKSSSHREEAQKLLDFVLSAPIQAELSKAGLAPAN